MRPPPLPSFAHTARSCAVHESDIVACAQNAPPMPLHRRSLADEGRTSRPTPTRAYTNMHVRKMKRDHAFVSNNARTHAQWAGIAGSFSVTAMRSDEDPSRYTIARAHSSRAHAHADARARAGAQSRTHAHKNTSRVPTALEMQIKRWIRLHVVQERQSQQVHAPAHAHSRMCVNEQEVWAMDPIGPG